MKVDIDFISTPYGRWFQMKNDTEEWVNFMRAMVDKDTELYAEIPLPSEVYWKDQDEFRSKYKKYRFDVDSFFLLKNEILAQAKELGISEDVFQLHPDQCFGMDKYKDFEDYKKSDDYRNYYLPVKPLINPYLMCSNRTGANPVSIRANQEYISRGKDPYKELNLTNEQYQSLLDRISSELVPTKGNEELLRRVGRAQIGVEDLSLIFHVASMPEDGTKI